MDFGSGARGDTAVHESGHAVARVLSIGRVGINNENAIRWIEMDWGTPHCSVFELPLNMPGLKEFGEREGIRSIGWAGVRLFEITAGAAAQAKFTGVAFDSVWYDGGCSDDRQKAIETCQRIGLNGPEATGLLVEWSKEACAVMDKTDVWRAVLTLAERLPTTGRMAGDTVVSIVQNALRAL